MYQYISKPPSKKLVLFSSYIIAFLPYAFTQSTFYLGILAIIGSFMGFLRLISLMPLDDKSDQSHLSIRILKSLKKDEKIKSQFILQRFLQKDFTLWALLFFTLTIWAFYCSFYPHEISSLKQINSDLDILFKDFELDNKSYVAKLFTMNVALLIIFMTMISSFVILSYTYSRTNVLHLLFMFGGGFFILSHYILFTTPIMPAINLPDLSAIKGTGLGQANIIFNLHPDLKNQSGSFLTYRYIETGFIGAYGFYGLVIIPAVTLIKSLSRKKTIPPIVGLIAVSYFIAIDALWLIDQYTMMTMVMGWTIIMTCWGHAGYSHSRKY